MRPVDRIAGLEADHAPPAALGECRPRVGGVESQLRKRRGHPVEDRDPSGQVERVLLVQPGDAGVLAVGGPEAALGLPLLVIGVGVLDVEDGEQPAVLVGERDAVCLRSRLDGEADGERPRQAVREPHLLDHALVVVRAHEALERRERTAGEHVEVGDLARRQGDRLEPLDAVGALAQPVDERASVRMDQPVGVRGNGVHAVTCDGTSPSSSSFAITTPADSSGVLPSVSTTISASSGSSYGSSTPVKPVISPANAFL